MSEKKDMNQSEYKEAEEAAKKGEEVGKEEDNLEEQQEQEREVIEEAKEEPSISDEELVALCRERVCPECPEKKEKDDEMLRVKAEAENFRKRMNREKEQYCKYATESILEDILPVIDNLELAAEHGRKVEDCKDIVQGVDMTIKIFMDTLKKHGLEPVEIVEGQEFDPTWHEAMAEEEREDMESGNVVQIMQKGYKLKDRLLRPARVIVSKNKNKNSN